MTVHLYVCVWLSDDLILTVFWLKGFICFSDTNRLRSCRISDGGCAVLSSALRSNLRELDLSENYFRDSGVKQLSYILEEPQCKLGEWHYSAAVWFLNGCQEQIDFSWKTSDNTQIKDLSRNNLLYIKFTISYLQYNPHTYVKQI